MADENLSQEEIGALLRSQRESDAESDQVAESAATRPSVDGKKVPAAEEYLSADQMDALGEFYNIAMGRAATVLSSILNRQVEITTPTVTLETWDGMREKHPVPCLMVIIEYSEGLRGSNVLVVTRRDANIIANIMDEEKAADPDSPLDEYRQGILGEAMNQMIGGATVSISEMLGRKVTISPPSLHPIDLHSDAAAVENPFPGQALIQISFRFDVEDLVHSEMLQLMPVSFARQLADEILEGEEAPVSEAADRVETQAGSNGGDAKDRKEGLEPPVQVRKAEFQPLDRGDGGGGSEENLQIIMDIEVEVSVELGRTTMKIKDVMALGEGSVIELDKLVGEPMEIYANDKLIARGEVVVVDEDFGVRITEIVRNRRVQKSAG